MQKVFFLLKILIVSLFLFSQTSCENDGCLFKLTPTQINPSQEYSETIAADYANSYSFTITVASTYTISVTECASNISWTLYNRVVECLTDLEFSDIVTGDDDEVDGDEVLSLYLSAGEYMLVVSENDDVSSSYTLAVYPPTPDK